MLIVIGLETENNLILLMNLMIPSEIDIKSTSFQLSCVAYYVL